MYYILKEGNISNIKTQEILLEKVEDFDTLPQGIPEGSIAYVPTPKGLDVRMKGIDGLWKKI